METESKNLERAIINWINTFPELSKKSEVLDDLLDGQILAEIMHKIAPQLINLSNISQDPGLNFVLRMNNLNYLYEAIGIFYTNILGKPFDKNYVDIMALAKNGDHIIFYNLVEYILGAIVQCEQKEVYIPAIMTLDESSQTELMYLIEKILAKSEIKNTSMEMMNASFETRNGLAEKQNSSFVGKSENKENRLLQKLDELEIENNMLNTKLDEALDERDRLKSKVSDLQLEIMKKSDEIRNLNSQKEQFIKQLSAQEANEDLQNELKFKDKKILELNKYIEELRSNHEIQVMNIKSELDNYKKKVNQLSKLEITLEFYKEKYEDCAKLAQKISDVEAQNESLIIKIQDHDKQVEAMNAKIKKVVDQYTVEKDKNIDLELTITKKDAEIESLRNDGKRLEGIIAELEAKVIEQHKVIEQCKHDLEENARSQNKIERVINGYSTMDENHHMRSKSSSCAYSNEVETEKELLKKDNELLSERCKNLQKDNELLKLRIESETARQVEKLNKENENLKEENIRLKNSIINIANENNSREIWIAERKKLIDEIDFLKQKLETPYHSRNSSNSHFDELRRLQEAYDTIKEENEGLKRIIFENTKKINDLKNEVDYQKQMFNDLDDQKEEELRVLAAAFHELALKNFDLEKRIASHTMLENKIKNSNISSASSVLSMKNSFKK